MNITKIETREDLDIVMSEYLQGRVPDINKSKID